MSCGRVTRESVAADRAAITHEPVAALATKFRTEIGGVYEVVAAQLELDHVHLLPIEGDLPAEGANPPAGRSSLPPGDGDSGRWASVELPDGEGDAVAGFDGDGKRGRLNDRVRFPVGVGVIDRDDHAGEASAGVGEAEVEAVLASVGVGLEGPEHAGFAGLDVVDDSEQEREGGDARGDDVGDREHAPKVAESRSHTHVFVTVGTNDNRLVTKCACGEPSPIAVPIEAPEFKPKRVRKTPPVESAPPVQHEALRPGRCNAADPLSPLRCRLSPGHRVGAHSWVTS